MRSDRRCGRTRAASEKRQRLIKAVGPRLAVPAAILAVVCAGAARAADAQTGSVSPGQVQAKMHYCEICHGAQAQGFPGYYPIPRLAGQPVEYLEGQLKGFSTTARKFNVMNQVSHSLSLAMIAALATNFNKLNPRPVNGAPRDLAAAGKTIFDDGIPGAKVPPCASCHGADGKGAGQFPRLAGQLYPYVVRQLTVWRTERAEANASVMAPIARSLNETQIKAVAAYVANLE